MISEDIRILKDKIYQNAITKQNLLNDISKYQLNIEESENKIISIDLENSELLDELNKLNQASSYLLSEDIDLIQTENDVKENREKELIKEDTFQSLISEKLEGDSTLVGSYISYLSEWKEGVNYLIGRKIIYHNNVYKVVQSHLSQVGWEPDKASSLFSLFSKSISDVVNGEVLEFVKPTGVHDSYMKGDKVRFEGSVYESLIDSNVYSPAEYPNGWRKIE